MRPTTDPAASYIHAMSLASPSDNAMAALYRVALGPVNTDHYLPVFDRFDTTGRATTSWNWAASLCTLNWLVFRQVWGGALLYVAAAEGLALLVFALGRPFLNWPQGVELGVVAAFAVLAFAVPGLYGNAMLHADIRKRIARALAASRTVSEACALLAQQASSRKRLKTLVFANGVIAAIVAAGMLASTAMPRAGVTPRTWETAAVTVADAAAAATKAPPAASEPSASTASAAAAADTAPQPPKALAPSAATPTPSGTTATPGTDSPSVAASAPVQASATPPSPPLPSPPSPTRQVADAPALAAPTALPARAASSPSSPQMAPPRARAPQTRQSAPAAKVLETAPPPVGTTAGYYINVGLFADETNARKAQARLLNEGFPAFRQELHTANGRRIRVRVGPYARRGAANAAAASIRAMALDAVVFRQGR